MIKALLLDFDGTLVERDMLSEVIDLVGKKEESERIDHEFQTGKLQGLSGLIARINLLKGVSVDQIQSKVREDLALMAGARELIQHCQVNQIITILASGSITPILEVYQWELGIDYIVGPTPHVKDSKIEGITKSDFPRDGHFKVVGIKAIIDKLGIHKDQCVAIGDGRGDLPMFELAHTTIAINPKGGIEEFADYVVSDLFQVVEILEKLQ